MEFQDKKIICKDCGNEFIFTAGEQEWYAQKGFSEPARCSECRKIRKAEKQDNNQDNIRY